MPSLKKLISDVNDPNDYDGVVMICTKGNQIANLGFTGQMPQGIDQKVFLYRLLQEAQYAVTFSPNQEHSQKKKSPKKSNLIKH
tara:strand:+ start:2976 stop:3227 length:252 start_codon:yes stop_codon:yes gene_type:complete